MAQPPDWLVYDGRRRMLHSYPLEAVLRTLPVRPDFRLHTDGNTRGYEATWEIREDETLWLTALRTEVHADLPDPGLRIIFPDMRGPVFASWVYQRLRSRDSQHQRFNPMGYSATFRSETRFRVWAGRLISVEEFETTTSRRTTARFTSELESIFGAEEAAFLRAIGMNPRDSAPRLIYADWLEERADPRSDVIRLHERIAAMGATGTTHLNSADGSSPNLDRKNVLWKQLLEYDHFAKLEASHLDEE